VLPGTYTWHAYSLNASGQVIDKEDFSLNITPYAPSVSGTFTTAGFQAASFASEISFNKDNNPSANSDSRIEYLGPFLH